MPGTQSYSQTNNFDNTSSPQSGSSTQQGASSTFDPNTQKLQFSKGVENTHTDAPLSSNSTHNRGADNRIESLNNQINNLAINTPVGDHGNGFYKKLQKKNEKPWEKTERESHEISLLSGKNGGGLSMNWTLGESKNLKMGHEKDGVGEEGLFKSKQDTKNEDDKEEKPKFTKTQLSHDQFESKPSVTNNSHPQATSSPFRFSTVIQTELPNGSQSSSKESAKDTTTSHDEKQHLNPQKPRSIFNSKPKVPKGFIRPKKPFGMSSSKPATANSPSFGTSSFGTLASNNSTLESGNHGSSYKATETPGSGFSSYSGQTFGNTGLKGKGILANKFGASFGKDVDPYAYGTTSTFDHSVGYNSPATHVSGEPDTTTSIQNLFDTFDTVGDDVEKQEEYEISKTVSGLSVKLMPHQVEGLEFLMSREQDKIQEKGGLLCDDMGLGKTVQSIALILSNPPTSQSINKVDIKATLVIAPLSLAPQWAAEIKAKAPHLEVLIHHGPQRTKSVNLFESYDVVVTTFQVVANENPGGPLFNKKWWRVILDEAHTIKNHNTKTAQACYAIKSNRRWCLTGTPIQNSADDLQSLICFLNIKPYNDRSVWNSQVAKAGSSALATQRLRVVLRAIMLRRTKALLNKPSSGAEGPALKMMERNVHRINVQFSPEEQQVYNQFETRAIKKIECVDSKDDYMTALVQLLRLRQICDHVALATVALSDDEKESMGISSKEDEDDDIILSKLLASMRLAKEPETKPNHSLTILDRPSTKIKSLVEILLQEKSRKTIVFSQFTSFFPHIEQELKNRHIGYIRYDGTMSWKSREQALERLRNDPQAVVLLCSLKAGALGLNLTCASRVVLMDPWWNPMVSEQAIDRVHRIGQVRDVDVYEMVMNYSVEERIVELQEKKRAIAKAVIENGGRVKVNNKLTLKELLALFY